MRNFKKMFILCSLALVCTIILAAPVFAANESLMTVAADKALRMFKHVKGIIFIVGGFGLVGIAFQAIFGKVKWSWFAGLAIGLAILAAAGAIVNYATGDRAGAQAGITEANSTGDTFGTNDAGITGN